MFQADQVLQERYQLQRRLGQTAAGHQTWLAQDRDAADRQVVLKLLVFNPEFNWNDLKLFEREAQVLAELNHPQIPQYRDFFVADAADHTAPHWWALVQEFVPGDSLQDLVDRGYKFAPEKIRAIALEILEILTYLHQLSPPVLHRDIKPSNLILGEDDKIYLIDFGAVQDQAKVTGMTFTVIGTIGYAPMEQFWGRSVPASDLYGLGTTLIHLITGISPADLPQKDLRLQFAHKLGNPAIAASWLEKMVEPALEHRYRSAKAAQKDLLNGTQRKPRQPTPNWVLSLISPNEAKFVKPLIHSMQVENLEADLLIRPSRTTQSVGRKPSAGNKIPLLDIITDTLIRVAIGVSILSMMQVPALRLLIPLALVLGIIFWAFQSRMKPGTVGLKFSGGSFEIFQFSPAADVSISTTKVLSNDRVNTIHFVSAQGTDFYSYTQKRNISYWQVVIRTNETYILPWQLSETECLWLVQEIHDWLDRYHQG